MASITVPETTCSSLFWRVRTKTLPSRAQGAAFLSRHPAQGGGPRGGPRQLPNAPKAYPEMQPLLKSHFILTKIGVGLPQQHVAQGAAPGSGQGSLVPSLSHSPTRPPGGCRRLARLGLDSQDASAYSTLFLQ